MTSVHVNNHKNKHDRHTVIKSKYTKMYKYCKESPKEEIHVPLARHISVYKYQLIFCHLTTLTCKMECQNFCSVSMKNTRTYSSPLRFKNPLSLIKFCSHYSSISDGCRPVEEFAVY